MLATRPVCDKACLLVNLGWFPFQWPCMVLLQLAPPLIAANVSSTPHAQLVGKLMDGVRLEVPPRDQLPGLDTPAFQGLYAYVALMK